VNFLPMMMTYMPTSNVYFCMGFDYHNLQFTFYRDLFIKYIFPWNFFMWKPIDYKFIRATYDMTPVLYNCLDILTLWLLYFILMGILFGIWKAMFNFYIVVNIEEWYWKHVIPTIINLSFMKLTFTSMLALRYLRAYDWVEIVFSAGFGGIGLCIVIFYSCFEAWSAVLYYWDITEWKRPPYHWKQVLFSDFSIMHPTKYFYYW